MKKYPETIEHRWDILYQDYPEVYDRFASFPYSPRPIDVLASRFDFEGKVIVDNGAGTGKSAIVDYFQPVPDDVFLGYQETLSIDSKFGERRDLWRLYGYLAAVEVEGPAYLAKLIDAVQKYL